MIIIESMQCAIPKSTLQETPFDLYRNQRIYVRVIAISAFGDSIPSLEGQTKLIIHIPIGSLEVMSDTTSSAV